MRRPIYGLARMFQILTEDTRPELRVVRTMDEANRLMEVESPEFQPVERYSVTAKRFMEQETGSEPDTTAYQSPQV